MAKPTTVEERLAYIERVLRGEVMVPKLWARVLRSGEHSVELGADYVEMLQGTPGNPPAGSTRFYSDGNTGAKIRDSAGTETDIAAAAGPTLVRKTADETVNNSTTLQDDDDLALVVGANEVWAFRFIIKFQSPPAADFKFNLTFDAGSGDVIAYDYIGQNTALSFIHTAQESASQQIVIGSDNSNFIARVEGIIDAGSVGDNLKLQWAQNTATVGDTIVRENSYIVAWQLV